MSKDLLDDCIDYAVNNMHFLNPADTPPSTPRTGDCFYNTKDSCMYVYNGYEWVLMGGPKVTKKMLWDACMAEEEEKRKLSKSRKI